MTADPRFYENPFKRGNGPDPDNGLIPLAFTVASTLAGREPPTREWIVADWIPCRQVTLFSGHGEAGKTILALQLMIAVASGTAWLDLPATTCRVFGLFA